MNCSLCEAVKEKHRLVAETKLAYAIIQHHAPKYGHAIILPKAHRTNLKEITGEESRHLFVLLERIKQSLLAEGLDPIICMNTGKHSTQAHLHFHILPSEGGLRTLFAANEDLEERPERSDEDLAEMATYLRELIS